MSEEKQTREELLKKADLPNKQAMAWHPFYKGKIEIVPKCKIDSFNDFGVWYTPGVAQPCRAIHHDVEQSYEMTNRWNTVAVVSDGSRVLGLGDIGAEAGMPVMEGKALLFKYLGGVDAVPLCLNCHEPEELITAVKWLQPSFGGINLEDISQPKCFKVLDTLRADKDINIPVWHDDQQGTATITVAGVINALKIVGKKMKNILIALNGAGSANIAVARVLVAAGVPIGNIMMTDSTGILHANRSDSEKLERDYPQKWHMATEGNSEQRTGGATECIKGTDVLISLSKSEPGIITQDMIRSMASDSIVYACANPLPEIWPWDAKEAGARIVGTGRSDFSNQVNNSLGFPGIFRGTLDVRAYTITDSMCIAAAYEIAKVAEDKGIHEEYVVPTMADWEVYPREAVAVGMKAMEEGVARIKMSRQELYERAESIIKRAREMTKDLMRLNYIPPAPPVEE